MNRILRVGNKFQVLVTPTYTTNPSFELMLGNWTDEKLRNYKIYEFDVLQDAMDVAFRYPSIDWNKLITINEDEYENIVNRIRNLLKSTNSLVELDTHLMSPIELKKAMFKRVQMYGKRFNLSYDANDIICVNIINQWTNNLIEISEHLKNNYDLHIKRVVKTPTYIKLIGLTAFGTTYEIRLWTTLTSQWARWLLANDYDARMYMDYLQQLLDKQKIIDNGDIMIR
jgi:hypothetical protein